jgi:hypothetical protein
MPELNSYDILTDDCHPQIHVRGLLPGTRYYIQIFDTYEHSNRELEVRTETTDIAGALKFRRKMPINFEDPFYPDYSFIIQSEGYERTGIGISPNPSSDIVNIDFLENGIQEYIVRVFNDLGQLVLMLENQKRLNVTSFPDGIYLVSVFYSENYKTAKLVVKH